jgi:hypothetical protein
MPKKRIPKSKLTRTHLPQKEYWLKDNYNKCLILTNDVIAQRYEITNGQIGFLLLVYDLQDYYNVLQSLNDKYGVGVTPPQ